MNITIDQTRLEKVAIFEVSLKLLREGKFHATPMNEIAYLSKISGALMDHVFQTREELLAELSNTMLRRIEEEVAEACKRGVDFRDCLLNAWSALYLFYARHPDAISFIEQFDNLNSMRFVPEVPHPGKLDTLIALFRGRADLLADTTPETLAWLLHENALGAAKMTVVNKQYSISPRKLAEIFWNGITGAGKDVVKSEGLPSLK